MSESELNQQEVEEIEVGGEEEEFEEEDGAGPSVHFRENEEKDIRVYEEEFVDKETTDKEVKDVDERKLYNFDDKRARSSGKTSGHSPFRSSPDRRTPQRADYEKLSLSALLVEIEKQEELLQEYGPRLPDNGAKIVAKIELLNDIKTHTESAEVELESVTKELAGLGIEEQYASNAGLLDAMQEEDKEKGKGKAKGKEKKGKGKRENARAQVTILPMDAAIEIETEFNSSQSNARMTSYLTNEDELREQQAAEERQMRFENEG